MNCVLCELIETAKKDPVAAITVALVVGAACSEGAGLELCPSCQQNMQTAVLAHNAKQAQAKPS